MIFDFDERQSDSPLVEKVWRTRSEGTGSFVSPAQTRWEIVLTKQWTGTTVTLKGPETKAVLTPVPEDAEFVGIVLKYGVFMLHLPVPKLVNGGVHLSAASGDRFWLYGSTWELPDFENADVFINQLTHQEILTHDPVVEAVLREEPLDVSLRTVQRRFKQATGLTHKTIQQIERAQQAVSLIENGMSIVDAAYEAGYYDQSHLTNALKRYIGISPAKLSFFSKISDVND